jgi:hypothetical protein
MKASGVDTDNLVDIDMSAKATDLAYVDNSANITMRGFRFCNAHVDVSIFNTSTAEWKHIDFDHNVFEIQNAISAYKCRGFLISDSYVNLPVGNANASFVGDIDTVLILKNNYIDHLGINSAIWTNGSVVVENGNMFRFPNGTWISSTIYDGITLAMNSTYLEFAGTVYGALRSNHDAGHFVFDALVLNKAVGAAVFSLGKPYMYFTVNLAVDYFAPAKVGETIIAVASITKNGNQIINTSCEVWNVDRTRMIAKGHSNLIQTKIET